MGKHLIGLERETQVKRKWAETCQSLAGGYLQSVPSTSAAAITGQPDNQNMPSAEEAWALKGQKCRKLLRKCEKLLAGGVPAGGRDRPQA